MRRAAHFIAMTAGAALLAPMALAQSTSDDAAPRAYVHVGASMARLADKGDTYAGGVLVTGAEVHTEDKYSPNLEAGFFVTKDIALAVGFSSPIKTENYAAGTLQGLGNLGTDTSGYASLNAQWHFNRGGWVQPYVGGGLGWFHVFDTEDGVVQNLQIEDAVGGGLQAGVDFNLTKSWSLYVDVKKMFIDTKATGSLGGAPIDATSILDPLLVSAGVGLKF